MVLKPKKIKKRYKYIMNPETYIIQNVTPGYHSITDLKLTIGPLEVVNLSYRDMKEVMGSQNLKDSLRAGYIRKISESEADRVANIKTSKMRASVTKLQQEAQRQKIEVDGKSLEMEPINISRTDAGKMSEQVSSAGYANDPLSYALALEVAQRKAEESGRELYVEDFAAMVERDPELVRRLITDNTQYITPLAEKSGETIHLEPTDDDKIAHQAVFATPPKAGSGGRTSTKSVRVAGPDIMNVPDTSDPLGAAEQIDLTDEN